MSAGVGLMLALPDLGRPAQTIELVQAAEELGYQSVWVPEGYGFDSVSLLGALAMRTRRIRLASGILNVFSRSPALLAQTAAGLDALSEGRLILGLGTSGHQVVEGWHGVAFERGVQRLREAVEVIRSVLRREPLRHRGDLVRAEMGLRLIDTPVRATVPVALATITPAGVALTAEVADMWMPTLFDPDRTPAVFAEALARGAARRDPALAPLRVCATLPVSLDDDATAARDRVRPNLALYLGGMGSRQRNYYASLVSAYGFAAEVAAVQEAYLGGDRLRATRLVPDQLVDALAACGSAEHCRARVARLEEGVDEVLVAPAGKDLVSRQAALEALAPVGARLSK